MASIEQEHADRIVTERLGDSRNVVIYLVVQESSQYIAIMDVLESSITDLTPSEVRARLQTEEVFLDQGTVEARLDKLREWGAASARTDASRILRHSDLLARNWKYTATPAGRQVQRFYRKVLANNPAVREIPLPSLARVVEAAEALGSGADGSFTADLIGRLFVNHDDLDAALVGAEDSLAGLVDRFDLNDESTAELKTLLVGYATHVASELELGSARVFRSLRTLRPRFQELATIAIQASDARVLIERGAISASHGGRPQDWDELLEWFDPTSGRAARFALRLVRALPGMHMNLRRLHTSSGAATSRSRALALARACANSEYGPAIFNAALADHPWRKLHGVADEIDGSKVRSWRDGPHVAVPELLRTTGRAGVRGRATPARDDSLAREQVRAARARRSAEHDAAVREVLSTPPGKELSEPAARVALAALLAATRADKSNGRRSAVRDGLRCTLCYQPSAIGMLTAQTWRAITPGRVPIFHLPHVPAGLVAHQMQVSEPASPQTEREPTLT
jgi:hypothetical protein